MNLEDLDTSVLGNKVLESLKARCPEGWTVEVYVNTKPDGVWVASGYFGTVTAVFVRIDKDKLDNFVGCGYDLEDVEKCFDLPELGWVVAQRLLKTMAELDEKELALAAKNRQQNWFQRMLFWGKTK